MKLKHRTIQPLPSKVYSPSYEATGKFDPTRHALLYQIKNKNGSSGNQKNAEELGPIGCLQSTHKAYGGTRLEGLGDDANEPIDLFWVIVDIDKIKGHEKITNRQYDEPVNKMFRKYDPRLKRGKRNKDSLVYQVDQQTTKALTVDEIHKLYDEVFGNGVKKTVYPPHTRQQEVISERTVHRKQPTKLLINLESAHTRFGKDKLNYLGLDSKHQVVLDFSGFFATWQIQDELGENDYWIETRNRSVDEILKDVEFGLQQNKRIWLAISTYNDSEHDKIKMLKIFRNANVACIIDEPDYQQWRQFDFFNEVLENVIS